MHNDIFDAYHPVQSYLRNGRWNDTDMTRWKLRMTIRAINDYHPALSMSCHPFIPWTGWDGTVGVKPTVLIYAPQTITSPPPINFYVYFHAIC